MKLLQVIFLSVVLSCVFACKDRHATLFEKIPSSRSGITFNNLITENDSINPLKIVNVYNGGGVGIGDFNNDGLQDIYFTAIWSTGYFLYWQYGVVQAVPEQRRF